MIKFKIEIYAITHSPWMSYRETEVKPNEVLHFTFPADFQARWIRFVVNKDCVATTMLKYE